MDLKGKAKFIFSIIIKFVDRHLMWALLVLGVFCYVLGDIFNYYDHTRSLSEPLKSLSKIIFGAGVFTGLTKSSYYTSFFQNRVFDVFYNPGEHFTLAQMKDKWLTLTEHLLSKKTEISSKNIANVIFDRFLNQDVEFYYKNMTITYDIILNEDTNTLNIIQNMDTLIAITDGIDEINIGHTVLSGSDVELKHLLIDDDDFLKKAEYTPDPEDPKVRRLNVVIKNNNRDAKVERCYEANQSILDEPYILNGYSRYVNGLVVKFKTTNCKAVFRTTGVTTNPQNPVEFTVEGNGYTRAVIAKQGDLTLPGQGFILILSKLV